MATLEERVDLLERTVAHVPTLSQVQTLVNNATGDINTLLSRLNALQTSLEGALADVIELKRRVEDHETRITALEP